MTFDFYGVTLRSRNWKSPTACKPSPGAYGFPLTKMFHSPRLVKRHFYHWHPRDQSDAVLHLRRRLVVAAGAVRLVMLSSNHAVLSGALSDKLCFKLGSIVFLVIVTSLCIMLQTRDKVCGRSGCRGWQWYLQHWSCIQCKNWRSVNRI